MCQHSCTKFVIWLQMPFIMLEFFTLLLVLHIQHVVLVSGLCWFKRSFLIFLWNCLTITHVVRRLITSTGCRPSLVKEITAFRKMEWLSLHLLPLAKFYNRVCSAIMFTSLTSTINRTQTVISLNALCTFVFEGQFVTGLNVLAKNRRNWQVNFIDSDLEVAKTRFQTFLRGKSVLFKWKCQNREFHEHRMERGEVLKRYCGWQNAVTLLKQTPKDRICIHAAATLQ